jgi:cytochrome c-type biogenesis protein CcmE
MSTYLKFEMLTVAILGTLGWLALNGIEDSKIYYKNVKEVSQMGPSARDKRIRIGGGIVAHSITREGTDVHFILAWEGVQMKMVYSGIEPVPDTFKDGAQALADGKFGSDGVFHAATIQAKWTLKFGPKPSVANPATHWASLLRRRC